MYFDEPRLESLADLKVLYDSLQAPDEPTTFWAVYSPDKKNKMCYNYHIADAKQSWDLLYRNLSLYEKRGGVLNVFLTKNPKQNHGSWIMLDLPTAANQNQSQKNGVNTTINGFDDKTQQQITDLKLELLKIQHQHELEKLKLEQNKSGINGFIDKITAHESWDSKQAVQIFGLALNKIAGVLEKAVSKNDVKETPKAIPHPAPSVTAEKEPQGNGEYQKELINNLRKIENLTNNDPLILLQKVNQKLEKASEEEKAGLLNYLSESE